MCKGFIDDIIPSGGNDGNGHNEDILALLPTSDGAVDPAGIVSSRTTLLVKGHKEIPDVSTTDGGGVGR